MRKKLYFIAALTVGLVPALWSVGAATISTTGESGVEIDVAQREARERAEYEARFGGYPEMPEVSAVVSAELPDIKPGVPDWVKAEVPAEELTAIYCAEIKWRSGDFFASLEAVQTNVDPLVKLAEDAGVSATTPDITSFLSNGQSKLSSICGASDLDSAEALGNEFQTWASDEVRGELEDFQQTFQSDIQKAGEALRAEVKDKVDNLVANERKTAEAEVRAYAEGLAASAKNSFESREEPPSQSEVDAMKASIERQVRNKAETKRQQIEDKVKKEATEILGDRPLKFQELGAAAAGVAERISADTASRKSEYEKYRDEARELKKALVLKTVDSRVTQGIEELNTHADDIAQAQQYDSTLMGVPEFKAKLLESKRQLLSDVGSAIDAGDDVALQSALKKFQGKWEEYRAQASKAASQALGQACDTASVRLAEAKPKLEQSLGQAQKTLASCQGVGSEECQEIAAFAPRLQSLVIKLNDLIFEIDQVESMCADPSSVDHQALAALLEKVKTDGLSAQTFGEALEAARDEAIPNSISSHCNRILPELKALLTEIDTEDLGTLRRFVSRCESKASKDTAQYCGGVQAFMEEYRNAQASLSEFRSDYDIVKAECAAGGNAENYPVIAASLRALMSDGESLRERVSSLRSSFGSQVSWSAFCRSAKQVAFEVKKTLSYNSEVVDKSVAKCEAKPLPPCDKVGDRKPEVAEMHRSIDALNQRAQTISDSCADKFHEVGTLPPESLVNDLGVLRADTFKLSDDNHELLRKIEVAPPQDTRGRVWLEAEDATKYNRTVGTDPNLRELNPEWRPPYYGLGSWLLSSPGQYMAIGFRAPVSGEYKIWVRDLASSDGIGAGPRRAELKVDRTVVATFSENTVGSDESAPGVFAWHLVGSVQLKSGGHMLWVTKRGGAPTVLDAFYVTIGDESPVNKE